MIRSHDQIVAAMADTARLEPIAPRLSWRDALFTSGPHGYELSVPGEPDRQLLAALADEYSVADAHLASVPARLHIAWLESILDIDRLPVVPDRVVASATVEPALAPAVVPAGTMLRGGKDAYGAERRYRTIDALTAHGAAVVGVRAAVPGGMLATDNSVPYTRSNGLAYEAPPFPISPPTSNEEAAVATPAALHVMRISSPVLGFASGDMSIRLTFAGATAVGDLRRRAQWRQPRADGTMSTGVGGAGSGDSIDLVLSGGCVDPDGGDPWIECFIPTDAPLPDALRFTQVSVSVTQRIDVAADAAYANDGALDPAKEFEPFGPTARKGDAFYVRCDEALSKPLSSLTVKLGVYAAAAGGVVSDSATAEIKTVVYIEKYTGDGQTIHWWGGGSASPAPLKIAWQRRLAHRWDTLLEQGALATMPQTSTAGTGSLPFTVGGQEGRYVRAMIVSGDLGWRAFQDTIADFATKAVTDPSSAPTMPTPPVPARYSDLSICYTTTPDPATRVESWSALRHQVLTEGTFAPFWSSLDEAGTPGMVAIGLALPDDAAGSTVSIYVVLDSASPCGSTEDPGAHWEWWDGALWHELPLADGTHHMREAGLLRFVAPTGWANGCSDVTADVGKWIRFVTDEPHRIGVIHDVIPDAVIAEYVSAAPDPAHDPTPATALAPGAIKGTLAPIKGVKKVTNLASVRGRGPESDADFGVRASSLVRHRGRAINAWDYEQLVYQAFPEVAALKCLPHTNSQGHRAPGVVGLVVIPDQRDRLQPRPSVSLAGRIGDALRPAMPMGASLAIMCPIYVPVSVSAKVTLRRGVAALTGKAAVAQALDTLLHPTGTSPTRWGVALYASTLIATLERVAVVDVVTSLSMEVEHGVPVEVVEVDDCRGLYCSSGAHLLTCEEQL